MSTNQQNSKNEDEEVDLGSLFVIIGKGFSKLFNLIGTIFKGIFNIFISILLFFKTNFIKIAIAGVVGFGIGLLLEVRKSDRFESEMLVQPNFKSSKQLYNNINYYNDLVKQKDIAGIENTFNLNQEEALSLKKFIIEPVINENDIINSYNDFIIEIDTTTIKSFTFEEFKGSFTDLDYKIHKINVVAEKNNIFNKLDEVIISSVIKNKYFNRLKELTNENLNRTDSIYRENLVQIDTLRKVYMQVLVEEAKKQTSGTNIDLGGEKRTTKEIELFDTNRRINADLKKIAIDKSEKYEVINIISNFQPIGSEVKGITKNSAIQFLLIGVLGMIIILLMLKVNNYLNNYKK